METIRKKAKIKYLANNLPISGTSTVYSNEVKLENAEYFSLFIKASGTSPDLKIVREYSFDGTNFYSKDLLGNEDILTSSFTATDFRIIEENLKYAIWLRYRIEGNPNNGNDTTITIVFVYQNK